MGNTVIEIQTEDGIHMVRFIEHFLFRLSASIFLTLYLSKTITVPAEVRSLKLHLNILAFLLTIVSRLALNGSRGSSCIPV